MITTLTVNNLFRLSMGTAAVIASIALFNFSTATAKAENLPAKNVPAPTPEIADSFVGIGVADGFAYIAEIKNGSYKLRKKYVGYAEDF